VDRHGEGGKRKVVGPRDWDTGEEFSSQVKRSGEAALELDEIRGERKKGTWE